MLGRRSPLWTNKFSIIISCSLILLSILLLGLIYPNWYFFSDDFGLVWNAKIESLSELSKHFAAKGLHFHFQPSNYNIPEQTFFSQLYRPLLYIFYSIQYLLFGFSAYGFLIVSAFFHGINSALIFHILKRYTTQKIALFTSFYFAFHLSLIYWFGWITGQQHIINVTLTLVTIILFIRYKESRKSYFYFLSCFALFTSLLIRETNIIIPFWLTYALFFQESYKKSFLLNIQNIPYYLLETAGFWIVTISVFVTRALLFPLKKTSGDLTTILSLSAFIKDTSGKFFHLVTFLTDIFNLAWMPGNIRLIKGSILAIMLLITFALFLISNKKKILYFLTISGIMFMWPAIVRFYTSRFLYISLPFFILGFIILLEPIIKRIKESNGRLVKRAMYLPAFLVLINAITLPNILKKRERELSGIQKVVSSLTTSLFENHQLNQPLCFLGIPEDLFITGLAQAMYINGFPANQPIYYDKGTFFSWYRKQKGSLSITKTNNTFTLSASNNALHLKGGCGTTCMGHYTILKKNSHGRPSKMTWTPDKNRYLPSTKFIIWNNKSESFQELLN